MISNLSSAFCFLVLRLIRWPHASFALSIIRAHKMAGLCRSEAKDMLGDDWVQIQRRVVQQHGISYQRAAWNKVYSPPTCYSPFMLPSPCKLWADPFFCVQVLQFITGSGGASSGDSGISKSQLKERFVNLVSTYLHLNLICSWWNLFTFKSRNLLLII